MNWKLDFDPVVKECLTAEEWRDQCLEMVDELFDKYENEVPEGYMTEEEWQSRCKKNIS